MVRFLILLAIYRKLGWQNSTGILGILFLASLFSQCITPTTVLADHYHSFRNRQCFNGPKIPTYDYDPEDRDEANDKCYQEYFENCHYPMQEALNACVAAVDAAAQLIFDGCIAAGGSYDTCSALEDTAGQIGRAACVDAADFESCERRLERCYAEVDKEFPPIPEPPQPNPPGPQLPPFPQGQGPCGGQVL